MAVLLDLRGQRAATAGRMVGVDAPDELVEGRARQPRRVDHRVARRHGVGEQTAVLDERQAVAHQRRHVVEPCPRMLRVAAVVSRVGAAVEHRQPSLRLLEVRGGQPAVDV